MNVLKSLPLFLLSFFIYVHASAQIDARLFRYPDVSETHITFSYGGDIWVVEKSGGVASKLSSPAGQESWPKFSPDGSNIAFSGNYDGNIDVYVISVNGGVPSRVTYHGGSDRVLGWHPVESKILFASSRESGRQRYNQLYLVDHHGGMAEKLPVPYGENASFSPDGDQIVYTDKSRLNRTWKRYRGGMAPDIFLFNLTDLSHSKISPDIANDELPMWSNDKVYFLSDRGPEKRFNLWVYDLESNETRQLTTYSDFDVHHPSLGPNDIVFEANGKLNLLNLSTESITPVDVEVVTDLHTLKPQIKNVKKWMHNAYISHDGNRVVIEARGDLFSVPAEEGFVKNLTSTSGTAERYPAWSPDGQKIAFWSDESGEYELHIINLDEGTQQKLTSYGPGYRYQLYWSPNSEMIAFVDQAMEIKIYDLENDETMDVDEGLWMYQGNLTGFSVDWSPDSRWLTYDRGEDNRNSSVFIYDTDNNTRTKITSAFYNDYSPAFDPEGKYLYFLTNRAFNPVYSDFDNTFIYTDSKHIAAISLNKDTPALTAPENDEVEVKKEKGNSKDAEKDKDKKKDEKETGNEAEAEPVEIDFEGLEQRTFVIPVKPGNYRNLSAVKGKVIYQEISSRRKPQGPVKYYDVENEEEKTIIQAASDYMLSRNNKKMLVAIGKNLAVIAVQADQKPEKKLPVNEMTANIDPREEWRQIFNEAWRLQRDFFYDEQLHGVNWEEMKDYYGELLEDAITRYDVNFIIGEMIAELNASHTYRGGGDTDSTAKRNVGYLGVNWEADNGHYRIKEIIKTAPWEIKELSPLTMPGVDVNEGDYIIAVNGVNLRTDASPYSAFQGLANKTVELTVNSKPTIDGAKKVIVKTMNSEHRLRHLQWIEQNRKTVEKAANGRVGYIYVRSTGLDGQQELIRQFSGQWHLDALIIDERFNSGGQIPDRFIELLDREPLAYWAVRHGKNWQWPPVANFGPKAMLINGWSGSGGDAFPDFFKKKELGPLIGTRTWGGLIGITGAPPLIDGGIVTVPTFRMYHPDATWFHEGHGVEPDIHVPEDPTKLAKGTDPQLQEAIEYILEQLEENPVEMPEQPVHEER